MSSANKDTVYIDIDDEITSIIEKVKTSPSKIVALVLPKRATMLQSIVNMKLLKRAAEEANKNLVLITSEKSLLPLAGAVGLHVAKTLQSKPEIPALPDSAETAAEESVESDGQEVEIDPSQPVGKLAGLSDEAKTIEPEEETIEVDPPVEEAPVTAATKPKPKKKTKGLKIPNFNKFRLRLFLGIAGLILLIIGWYLAVYVLPSANIVIKTDTSTVTSDLNFTVRSGLEATDPELSLVPGATEKLEKTATEKVAATGQKDVGKKASGDMTLSIDCNDIDDLPPTIPAGTGVSNSNLTFITQSSTSLTTPNFDNGCSFTGSTKVVAQNSGDQYNLGARQYSVAGYPNVVGFGGDMSGGTSKVVKVVRQEDINGARAKLVEGGQGAAKAELIKKLEEAGFRPLEDTFRAGTPTIEATPKAGTEADEVSVESVVTYTMSGVRTEALTDLIKADVEDDIDTARQSITDYGLDNAAFRVLSVEPNGDIRMSAQTLVTAGPQINEADLKKEIVGKKKGQTIEIIRNRPGVADVTVDYSPFWVYSTPRKDNKINITLEATDNHKQNSADDNDKQQ